MQIAPDCMASLLLAIGRLCSLCLLDHRKRHAAVNRPAHTKSFATRDWIPMTRSQSCSDGYSCHAHAARSLPGGKAYRPGSTRDKSVPDLHQDDEIGDEEETLRK